VWPSSGDGGGGGLNLRPIGDVAAGREESAGVLGGEIGLIGAREAPDAVALSEQVGGERTTDAGARAGEDELHTITH